MVAWDTELFGHWWHEGPLFLEHVLRMLPEAGVRLATLAQVVGEQHESAEKVDLPGRARGAPARTSGCGPASAVADLAAEARAVADRLLARRTPGRAARLGPRDRALDDLAREALLLLASDWAFMVSRDSAAGYARDRHDGPSRPAFCRLVDGSDARRDRARRQSRRDSRGTSSSRTSTHGRLAKDA